jgi:anti-sigma factor RsiW
MTHLTDELLNEFLDGEVSDRAETEKHLAECADCAARLAAFQALFADLDSLPEVTMTHDLAAPVTRTLTGRAALPRSLRLTVILQAALTVIAIIFAAPFVTQLLAPYLASVQSLSLTEMFLEVQIQWALWLDMLSQFQIPSIPEIPTVEVSNIYMTLTLTVISILWLVGNGLLLRNKIK